MRVLVTGGAGYIGSVVTEELLRDGHEAIVYDNLVKGHRAALVEGAQFVEADLLNADKLRQTLRERKIEAVIHMAAYSLVGESVEQPAKYYHNNITAGLALLDAMREENVQRLVFSSTAATYGEPEKHPIEETDPNNPTNPYGESKLAFEHALRWYDHAYKLRYASLRYFNAAGATQRCGEMHDPETHIIPIVLQAAAGKRSHVEIYGDDYSTRDGTCVRDYIHVVDLARAHILALKILHEGSRIYNLDTARAVTNREIAVKVGARRPGDPAVLVASSAKIKRELGWQPQMQDLRVIIESAWDWMQRHPNGYEE
jgi:UDP-glucose 4-epimerase